LSMRVEVCSLSDTGRKKNDRNQDSCYVKTFTVGNSCLTFGIVCDGVGSFSYSEIASTFAVNSFSEWFEKFGSELSFENETTFSNELYKKLSGMIDVINRYILDYSSINSIKLGTTLSLIFIKDNVFYIMHIGDTRIYALNDSISKLTTDHTFVNSDVEKGLIDSEAAKRDKRSHILTQCIGVREKISPEFITGTISGNTKFLICSDGFRNYVTDEGIYWLLYGTDILTRKKLTEGLWNIVRSNRKQGENDDITAVMIQISEV